MERNETAVNSAFQSRNLCTTCWQVHNLFAQRHSFFPKNYIGAVGNAFAGTPLAELRPDPHRQTLSSGFRSARRELVRDVVFTVCQNQQTCSGGSGRGTRLKDRKTD